MAERVEVLFGEYAAAYSRGERPQAREFLERAGGKADELASLIDAFLARAPAPAPDEQAVELFEAWQAGESPLLRLRTARGVTRDAVVAALVRTLGLDVKKKEKVQRYYHELEAGVLEPERVDRRVWDALAETLGARVSDLLGWRPRTLEFPVAAFARAAEPMMAKMAVPEPREEPEQDEIDRLFRTDRLADLSAVVAEARQALASARPLKEAEQFVPGRPGLYAIYAGAATWLELGLGKPPDERPLYVGKAEESLISRDLKTHFGDGRTGQSTLRRSFAALLHDSIGLRGVPRNPAKPAYFANYGLTAEHDAVLTKWMRERLELATWGKPDDCAFALGTIERALLGQLLPPLNIKDVVTPWTGKVKAARAVMAAEARAWAKERR